MRRLLLTRPQADAVAFAEKLGVRDAVICPVMEMRVTGPLPPLGAGLIFSSANGVAAYVALGGPRGLPAWCVGARTGRAAGQAGLVVQAVAATAEALVRLPLPDLPLTHLHGQHTRGDIAATLRARGLRCTQAAIYDQVARPLNAAAMALLRSGAPVVVPLFSPRTAQLFRQHCPPEAWARITPVAISPATAQALPDPARAHVAATPDGAAMIQAVRAALNTKAG